MLEINYRNVSAALIIAASALTLGCSSEARPVDLTPIAASALISQRWSRDELSHFKVVFHSDTVVECGVTNDLWKLTETTDRGYTRTAYQLTEKGNKVLFAIDLSDSGKGHAITLRGPYGFEVTNITPGSQPDTRYVFIHWGIDWDKASPDLKACVPKFEMSGNEIALFQIDGRDWRFVSYLSPEDAAAVQSATPAP